MRQLFFSRDDASSIRRMHKIFTSEGIYLIQNKTTLEYLMKDHTTTLNTQLAMNLKTYGKAMTYCVKHKFTEPDGWTIVHIPE